MFHVSPSVNRASITRHGLDWRRMGATRGIAGSLRPELPAVFLTDMVEDERGFFVGFAREPVDVWAVRVDGLWLENGPDGWYISPEPIEPARLRLTLRDWMR